MFYWNVLIAEAQSGEAAKYELKWLPIGPFPAGAKTQFEALGFDFLKQYTNDLHASSEVCISETGINELMLRREFSEKLIHTPKIDFHNALCISKPDQDSAECFYAITCLESNYDHTAYGLLANIDPVKVYVNNQLSLNAPESASGDAGERPNRLISLPLKKGLNSLLVKATSKKGAAGFRLDLYKDNELCLLQLLKNQNTFFTNPVVEKACDLQFQITTGNVAINWSATCRRFDRKSSSGKTVEFENLKFCSMDRVFPKTTLLLDGLYEMELRVGAHGVKRLFFIGQPEEFVKQNPLLNSSASTNENMALLQQVELLRLEDLLSLSGKRSKDWQYGLLDTLRALYHYINPTNTCSDEGENQLYIRGFKSGIDDSIQVYRFAAPKACPSKLEPKTLIVIMPTVVSSNRPFIKSSVMRSHNEALTLAALASNRNLALVWPGYRNTPYGHACELTHIDEVLKDLEKYVSVDRGRIVLVGICGGAFLAEQVFTRWPERFAGIAFFNGIFHREGRSYKNSSFFSKNPTFNKFLETSDPGKNIFCTSVNGSKIFILNDDPPEGHGELGLSVGFIKKARENKIFPAYRQLAGAFNKGSHWRIIFDWACAKKVEAPSAKISPIGLDNSIESVFSEKFLLVWPSSGSPSQLAAMEEVKNEFKKMWRDIHFSGLHSRTDIEVTDDDIKSTNLVLLGNAKINKVWRQIVTDDVPHAYACREDLWKTAAGSNDLPATGYHIMATNKTTGKKILFIGASNPCDAAFGNLDLSTTGWYSYAFWKKRFSKSMLIDAGIH